MIQEEKSALTIKIQNAGSAVVEAKAGAVSTIYMNFVKLQHEKLKLVIYYGVLQGSVVTTDLLSDLKFPRLFHDFLKLFLNFAAMTKLSSAWVRLCG